MFTTAAHLCFIYLILCNTICSVKSLNKSSCSRFLPQHGTWIDQEPYWIMNNCPSQKFGKTSTVQCMKGRTFYVIGNSVARQAAFQLIDMLGGGSVKREGQRDLCPKHETFWGANCHDEFEGVKIRFLHVQWMDGFNYKDRGGFPFIKNLETDYDYSGDYELPNTPAEVKGAPDFWEAGGCENVPMEECLITFFNGSTKDDVLLFNVGTSYSVPSDVIDMAAWLRSSVAAFRANVASTFSGHVFRQSSAQFLGYLQARTELMRAADKAIWELMRPASSKEGRMWYTIDQWAINKDRDNLYNDHIHYVGPLSYATVHQMLNTLCPFKGDIGSLALHNYMPQQQRNKLGYVDRGLNDGKAARTYIFIDHNGALLDVRTPAETNASCLPLLEAAASQRNEQLLHIPLAMYEQNNLNMDIFPEFCTEGSLLQATNSRQVFVVSGAEIRGFNDADSFLRRGYDFNAVHRVAPWPLAALKVGSNI